MSPQIINISPILNTAGNTTGAGNGTISITVNDNRPDPVIGSRGGIYSETALLRTSNNTAENLQNNLEVAFKGLGYTVSADSPGSALTVNLVDLTYTSERGTALYTISTSTTVRAICENNGTTLTNDYSITDSQDYVTTPSREENEQIINKTLASALNRMFQDEQLLACLAG